VWLRLKAAVPDNIAELASVRTLAESLLTSAKSYPREKDYMASIAMLVGDVPTAARESQQAAPDPSYREIPTTVFATSKAFLVYAAAGGPVDSLRALEERVTTGITNEVQPQNQAMARRMLLTRAATLAFPVYRSSTVLQRDTTTNLAAAEARFARGDTAGARLVLDRLIADRRTARPADLTLDVLYPEAWLRAATGDPRAALRTIAPTLDALRFTSAAYFFDVAAAGALLRAMQLRAELAARTGDADGARRWARAVTVLTQPNHAPR